MLIYDVLLFKSRSGYNVKSQDGYLKPLAIFSFNICTTFAPLSIFLPLCQIVILDFL